MAFSISAACKVAGVGRTKIYEAIASGDLRARKNGAKNLILREELQRWLESLPTEKAIAELMAAKAPPIAGAAG
ncbi:helix-turn-helix domain-containing protein [Nitrobacter sp. JJSN]|uniref:helix-turn-helix domain-containing protein n=1 Tax=Nitrobacter sp. JJSN TaxID=3453033 RepID=UPI003F77451E